MTSPNGSHLPLVPFGATSFVVVERTTRLVADETTAFPGFEVDVRTNLAGFERDRLLAQLDEINEARRVITAKSKEQAKRLDAERRAAEKAKDNVRVLTLDTEANELLVQMSRDYERLPRMRLPLIAPYIHAWNVYEPDAAGGYQPVPPPRVGGAESWAKISDDMGDWLVNAVINGYKSGKGLTPPKSGESAAPGNELTIGGPRINPQSTPASRKKSSTR